ncbi:MAG: carboxypeptidase-like regulatory domain-containing protein [Cyclobacteriaceae bacterium]|nr:carboxypeptidase-like regulatory domain-containing protein [Cyclobacteriaceae bacterium]
MINPAIVGYVKRGDNPQKGMPFAQVKLWEVPEQENPILHLLFSPPKYTRWGAISPEGYFKIDKLLPLIKYNNATQTMEFHHPYRFLKVSYNGFTDYKEPIPKILLGERKVLSDILLNPKGALIGEVVNERNQYIGAEVSVKNGNSVQTTLGGYKTSPSGTGGMFLTFPTKSTFEIKAPLGQQKLTVTPNNKEAYLSYDTIVNVVSANQNVGVVKLYDKAFRIRVRVEEFTNNNPNLYQLKLYLPGQPHPPKPSGPKPVTGAKVSIQYITPVPVATNSQGIAQFKFKSMGNKFVIRVEAPDGQLYETATATLTKDQLPEPTKDYYEVAIAMKKAAQVSGKVMVGNSLIKGARVFVKSATQGNGTPLQAYTNEQGEYVLKNVPMGVPLEVWAVKGQSQYIGDVKNLTLTNALNGNIDFELTQYNGIVLTELLGIPIEVTELSEENGQITLSGAFDSTPLPQNLEFENDNTTLPFSQIKIMKSNKKNPEGIFYGKPLNGNVPLDISTLGLKLGGKMVLRQMAKEGALQITDNGQGLGYLEAPTYLDISTFQVNVAQFDKNELRLANGTGPNQSLNITSISAAPTTSSKYYIVADDGSDLTYKLYNFVMVAKGSDSFVEGEALKLHSVLHTNLKNIAQADLNLDVGQVLIAQDKVASIVNKPVFNIPIDKWKLEATSWSISNNGFNVHNGVLKTGIVDVPFTGLSILPDKLHDNAKYNAANITLNGIAPVGINGDLTFGFDNGKGKWSLMAPPKNDPYAATLYNLPVIKPNEAFRLSTLALLSDGSVNMMVDKGAPDVSVHGLASFKASGIQVTHDALTVIGELDHQLPGVDKVSSGIVFKKEAGKVVGEILPAAINFSTNSVAISLPTTHQTFTSEKFESLGKVGQEGKFLFDIKLTHTSNAAIISLTPNQKFVMAEGKNSGLKDLKGEMEVKDGKWTNLVFDGDLYGTQGASGKLSFTVAQEVMAEKQSIAIKNIDLPFGNIALVYNFDEGQLEGNFHFDQKMSPSQHAKGDATVLVDNAGWSFVATGTVDQTNPNMEGQAGILFGDYPVTPGIVQRFQSTSYVYQKSGHLPDIFPATVKGFYFEGGVSLPVPVIPSVDFDFGLVSGHLHVNIGGDMRAKMEFSEEKTFGIGQSIFADASIGLGGSVVVACAGCSASVLAMLNFDGEISTGGSWFIDGEGLLQLKGSSYRGWGVCDSDCDGVLCDKSSSSASVTFGAHGHYGTDYKKFEFYLK